MPVIMVLDAAGTPSRVMRHRNTSSRIMEMLLWRGGPGLAVSIQVTELIRYMRQRYSRAFQVGATTRTTTFVAVAQFGSPTELVPHQYRTRSPQVPRGAKIVPAGAFVVPARFELALVQGDRSCEVIWAPWLDAGRQIHRQQPSHPS